jgi:hypothetical protein
MAAITGPYSLELTAHEDAKEAVAGTTTAIVAGKMKIYLGTAVNPGMRQSITGTLKACLRVLMSEKARRENTGDLVARASWDSGSVTVETVITNIAVTDVAIIVSSTFDATGQTHFYDETLNQLLDVFLEVSRGT